MRMRVLVATATVALVPALAACGSSSDNAGSSATPTASATAHNYVVPAATKSVLADMVALAKRVAAADGPTGKSLAAGLNTAWAPIEDGIKAQSTTAYIDIEDAMANLGSGDRTKAAQGATQLEAAIKAYAGDVSAPSASNVPEATQKGLAGMVTLAHQIAAADAAQGKALAGGLEGFWAPIEDGVKAQSSTTYIAIEDAMAELESGDKAKAAKGATDLESAINTYLGK